MSQSRPPRPSRWRNRLILLVLLPAVLVAVVYGTRQWLQRDQEALATTLQWGLGALLQRELRIGEIVEAQLGTQSYLLARNVSLGGPAWAPEQALAEAGLLRLRIDIPSLWRDGPVLLEELELHDARLALLAPPGQAPNWLFRPPTAAPEPEPQERGFPVVIRSGRLLRGVVVYRDPDQDIEASLGQAQVTEQAGERMLQLQLDGSVNGQVVAASGQLGPTRALLDGRDLRADLELALGDFSLQLRGSVGDLAQFDAVDMALALDSPNARPLLDLLGMPEVRDGPLRARGRITPRAPGLQLDLDASLEEFDLHLHGQVEEPLGLDGLALDFQLDGPSLAEAGAMFELQRLPALPYSASGRLLRRGKLLRIENGLVSAGEGSVTVQGELPEFPDIDDWSAQIAGENLSSAALAELLGTADLPPQRLDLEGTLASDDNGVELIDFRVESVGNELRVNGVVGEGPDYLDTRLSLRLAGADMSSTIPLVGFRNLPPQAFELQADIAYTADGWALRDGRLESPDLALELAGTLDRLVRTREVQARIGIATEGLTSTLAAYGVQVEQLRDVPLQFSAQVSGRPDRIELRDGLIRTAGGEAQLSGSLGDLLQLQDLDLAVQARGADLRQLLDIDLVNGLPELPYDLAGTIRSETGGLRLRVERGLLSSQRLQVDTLLRLDHSDSSRDLTRLQVAGDSAPQLLEALGLTLPVASVPYALNASVRSDAAAVVIEPLSLTLGRSDLSGRLSIAPGDRPQLDANLRSAELHMEYLLPDLQELEQEQAQREAAGQVFDETELQDALTRDELAEKLIPDTPLDLGVLRLFDGDLRWDFDRIFLADDAKSTAAFELQLRNNVLSSSEMRWEGTYSGGRADLTLEALPRGIRFELYFDSRRLPLLWLLAGEPTENSSALYRARLSGEGDTLRRLAASLDGAMALRGGSGRIANRQMDLLLGDIFGAVLDRLNPYSVTDPYTNVHCMAGAVTLNDGVIQAMPGLVIRTDKIDLASAGVIDLNNEGLDITFNTRSRKGLGISAGKAITPYLKMGGTLANPRLTLDPKGAAISGTAAIATAGWSVVATGLWDRWVVTSRNPCKLLVDRARKDEYYNFTELLARPAPD